MMTGNDNIALLHYNQVAQQIHEPMKKAIIYNNIACIHLRLKEYQKQNLYMQKALNICEEVEKSLQDQQYLANKFKKACREYNAGYAYMMQFMTVFKKLSLLKQSKKPKNEEWDNTRQVIELIDRANELYNKTSHYFEESAANFETFLIGQDLMLFRDIILSIKVR